MPDLFPKPVILLAFANEQGHPGNYLRDLPEETRRLRQALEPVEAAGLCQVILRSNATLSEILDIFQDRRYRNRIALFHYGGHANSYGLLLEAAGRQTHLADAGGLATFLGQQSGLRLAFLNGCATQPQVKDLLAAGVPAVIATAQAIDDHVAMEFAGRFYRGLAGGATLGAAYREAEGAVQARYGSASLRGIYWDDEPGRKEKGWPWHLSKANPSAAEWHLETKLLETRLPFEPETVLISAGPFLMGSDEGDPQEAPLHEVYLPAYRIGKCPVTNREYAVFVQKTGRWVAPELGWSGQHPPAERLDHPVAGVTWLEALAYCHWLSEQTGRTYTLPTEAEWEKAARGKEGRRYPWGDQWLPGRCHHGRRETAPVTAYPPQNDYGLYDLVGNVRQWTRSLWGERRQAPDSAYCYPWADDERNNPGAGPHFYRIYRGGAAGDELDQLRCAARYAYLPDKPGPRYKRHGFRVGLEITSREYR